MSDKSDKKNIFISYAREDIDTAWKLYHDLKKAGVIAWMDKKDILVGQNWKFEIRQAIKGCSYFLALLSSNSVSKQGYVQKELKMALDILAETPKSKIFLLPLRLDDCHPLDEELQDLLWGDLFPSYEEGLEKIIRVIGPKKRESERMHRFRSKPQTLSDDNVKDMLKQHDFFDSRWNKSGAFRNDFADNGDGTVTNRVTGLMWQKSGSDKHMSYKNAQTYIENLNLGQFAGHSDWRLPTLEELASLLENKKADDFYIDPVFNKKQRRWWTSDKRLPRGAWSVYFFVGEVCWRYRFSDFYVRAVRLC